MNYWKLWTLSSTPDIRFQNVTLSSMLGLPTPQVPIKISFKYRSGRGHLNTNSSNLNFSNVLSLLCCIQIFHSLHPESVIISSSMLTYNFLLFLKLTPNNQQKNSSAEQSPSLLSRFIHKNSWNWFFWVSSDPFKKNFKALDLCVALG